MNKERMISLIQKELGGSSVDIEIPPEDIGSFINKAVRKISPFVQDTEYITKPVSEVIDLSGENIVDVVRVFRNVSHTASPKGKISPFRQRNYADMKDRLHLPYEMSQYEEIMNRSFKYDDTEEKLYIDGYYDGMITIEVMKEVELEDLKDREDVNWVQDYAKALTMEALANVRGKFDVDSTPYSTDADSMRQRAESLQDELEQKLEDDGFFFMTR